MYDMYTDFNYIKQKEQIDNCYISIRDIIEGKKIYKRDKTEWDPLNKFYRKNKIHLPGVKKQYEIKKIVV